MKKPLIVAGPCSAESREQTLATCAAIAALGKVDVLRAGTWKPRTKPGGFEGSGVRGLGWLTKARELTGLPIMVEVATTDHVEKALKADVDMLWIGARTTGSPFSVQEIAEALRGVGKPLYIKNPLNPDIDLWTGAVERLEKCDVGEIGLIHRGFASMSGEFRNAPMWHVAIEMRQRFPEMTMLCDPSHICGNRTLLQSVAQRSADLGFDGLMLESHVDPDNALSDSFQQITPQVLGLLLDSIQWRSERGHSEQFVLALEMLRSEIDQLDGELLSILSRRMMVADKIGVAKRENNVAILQPERWNKIVERILAQADSLRLSREFLSVVLEALHNESIDRQNSIMSR